MGKKSSSSSSSLPPEYYEALAKQNELAAEQQEWFETEMYPWLQEQTNIANKNAELDRELNQQNAEWWQNYAKEQSDRQNAIADEYYNRQKEKFQPIEEELLSQVGKYKDGVEAERQAGYAIGDVASAMATQRQANNMRAQAYGINPSSGAYQSQQNAMSIQQAALQAAAANQARNAAQELGWNKNLQLAQLGQSYIGAAQGMYGTANQTASTGGSLSQNATNASSANSQSVLGNATNLGNIGLQSYGSLQNAWGQIANTAMNGWQAQQNVALQQQNNSSSTFGSVVGAVGTVAAAAF